MSAALAAWHYLRQKGLWLDGGGINHQGGSGQGVLPVASGRAGLGCSFSKLDASGATVTSMTSGERQTNQRPPAPPKKQRHLVYKSWRWEGGNCIRSGKNLDDVWVNQKHIWSIHFYKYRPLTVIFKIIIYWFILHWHMTLKDNSNLVVSFWKYWFSDWEVVHKFGFYQTIQWNNLSFCSFNSQPSSDNHTKSIVGPAAA